MWFSIPVGTIRAKRNISNPDDLDIMSMAAVIMVRNVVEYRRTLFEKGICTVRRACCGRRNPELETM